MHQTGGQHLLPLSVTHRSNRHERGQTEIKCACEKSTHRTSPLPPLAYLTRAPGSTHSYSDTTTTQAHKNVHEWLTLCTSRPKSPKVSVQYEILVWKTSTENRLSPAAYKQTLEERISTTQCPTI